MAIPSSTPRATTTARPATYSNDEKICENKGATYISLPFGEDQPSPKSACQTLLCVSAIQSVFQFPVYIFSKIYANIKDLL